jgi:hypothetical protein
MKKMARFNCSLENKKRAKGKKKIFTEFLLRPRIVLSSEMQKVGEWNENYWHILEDPVKMAGLRK